MPKPGYAIIIVLALTFFLGMSAYAQNLNTGNIGATDLGRGNNQFNQEGEVQYDSFGNPIISDPNDQGPQADSTKVRPRKPLESYFFDNATRSRANFAWNVDTRMNRVYLTDIDTLINNFNIEYIFMREDVGDAYLGNLGGGTVPLNFFRRPNFQDYSFAQAYYAYLYTPENAPFYNVKKPYTQIEYNTAGQRRYAEEIFALTHAQSVTPSTGFNVTYHTNKTKGMYPNQATQDTDISAGVHHTGKRYSAHVGYIHNSIDNFESGGVVDDWHITGTRIEKAWNTPMWLGTGTNYSTGSSGNPDKPRSFIKNNTLYTVHTYGIPLRRLTEDDFTMADVPAIYVGYSFEFQQWHRRYRDTFTGTHQNLNKKDAEGNIDPHYPTNPYFDNWYINPNFTSDSIAERKISNRVFVQLQPWDRDGIVGTVDAGVGMDNFRYYMFNTGDFITGDGNGIDKRTSYYMYGSVEGKFRKYFDWGGKASFVPIGYRNGDLDISANAKLNIYIKDKPLSLTGNFSFSRKEPSYWTQNYFSNHYAWQNSFAKENETRIDIKLLVPHINFEVSAHQSILNNRVYYRPTYRYDSGGIRYENYVAADCMPAQHTGTVSVTGIYARKDFKIGGLNLNHRAMMQWSTDQTIVPVPLFSAYISYFYEFNVVKDVLRVKIGLDARYNTPYYAFGYNAAIGQFYNQREKEVGGYPMVDFFVAAKWKRMRIRLKVAHLNDDLFASRNYFSVLHYPHDRRIFKLGISWGFYD